jgi:hypothetical protein
MRGNQTVWEINSTPSSEPPPSTTTNTKDHKKVMKPKKKKPSNLNIRKQGTILYIYILPSFFRRHKNHPHYLSSSWGLQTEKVPVRSRFQQVSSYHHCKRILLLLFLQFFTAEHCIALQCTGAMSSFTRSSSFTCTCSYTIARNKRASESSPWFIT